MSFTLLGILNAQAAGGAVTYWLSTLGGAGADSGESAATDSLGNVYSLGHTNSTGLGQRAVLLVKQNSNGVVQWQRTLSGTNYDTTGAVTVDSSNNVYIGAYQGSEGAGDQDLLVAKYSSSGVIQWQRILGGATYDFGYGIATDSSGNVYVVGVTSNSGTGAQSLLLAKYNSSGAILWQKTLSGTAADAGYGIAIDSSDNVYAVGEAYIEGIGRTILLAKYNSSGTIQWQRNLEADGQGFEVAIDSSDNVYVAGNTRSEGTGSYTAIVAKYNSSGTIQWQRILSGTGNDQFRGIAIDSNDNVYAVGISTSTTGGDFDYIIAKYDASGTIQYQRTLGGASNSFGLGAAIDSRDNVYLFGRSGSTAASGDDFLLAKLPNDGSLTGTYVPNGVNIVYAASSLTSATSTLPPTTSSLTSAPSELTEGTSTLTDASASLTSYFVEIGA
jgi:hypothetical protein